MSTHDNFSDSNRVRFSAIREVVFGETPDTPTMQIYRQVSNDLSVTKETGPSEEIRDDRQISDLAQLTKASGGSVSVEMSMLTYDLFLESVLGGAFSSGGSYSGAASWTVAAGEVTFTSIAGLTVAAGELVYIGTESVNNFYVVVSYTGSTLVVNDSAGLLTDGSGDVLITAANAMNGSLKHSYSIENSFLDVNKHQLFKGQRVSTFNLTIESAARVTGSFGFMGLSTQTADAQFASAYTEQTDTPGLTGAIDVAQIIVDDSILPVCIQAISMDIDNSLREQRGVGNVYPCGIGYGTQLITGSFTAYFTNWDLYDEFYQHNDVSLMIPLVDSQGSALGFYMPRVKLLTDPIAPGGKDSDIIQEIEYQAIFSPENGATIRLCKADNSAAVQIVVSDNLLPDDNEE